MQKKVSRLITQFVPEHYQLSITLERQKRRFSGLVTINGSSIPNNTSITVHAKELAIESAIVDGKAASFTQSSDDELIITHPDLAKSRRRVITIAFSGTITDAMHGLYPCYFTDDGVKKELLATQFESHHAREVFPCIDEPEAKATFDVTLTTETDVVTLGNMPVKNQKVEDGQLITTFATTPRMSTYLVAWVVGDLHKKTAVTKRGIEVNIWATPAQPAASLEFALDIATRTIDFFEDYFDTPYPLPKSDHVALPDFSSGAMENWGLITYREIALLADPTTTSVSSKHYIATVIAHELSHQWFGNLVTMRWWNNLWLNESFATLMEYLAVDALHPEWNVWLDFATTESIMALRRDSLEGVQPVQVDVHHPDEINTLFDSSIVYAKGARLLRMCQHYVGDEAFQAGLKAYFAAHQYNNTEGDDLWSALGTASGKDITKLMNAWISQSGYPVIQATLQNAKLTLSQTQFFIGPHKPSDKLWPIPLDASDASLPKLLSQQKLTLPYNSSDVLRLNVDDSAHFITHYDDSLLERLVDTLKNGKLQPLHRVQLLHEQTLLARAGISPSAHLITLLDAFKNEDSEPVWDMIALTIGELKKFVESDQAAENSLRALAGRLARTQYNRLGWEPKPNEDESQTKLRTTILGLMVYSQDKEVLKKAKKLYETHSLEELNSELRPLIVSSVVRYFPDSTLIDQLIETYKITSASDLQQDIASGLASTKDVQLIKRLLGYITDKSMIRAQDATRWFIWLMRNRDGRTLAWRWMRDNWSWVEATFGSDKSYDNFPRYSASMLTTKTQLDEYRAFFVPLQNVPALTRVISIGIGEIEGRVELIERDGPAVRQALINL